MLNKEPVGISSAVPGLGAVTDIPKVAKQPVDGTRYVIVTDPVLTPETTPVADPTVAIAGALLDQVPVGDVFESVAEEPTATEDGPLIAAGVALTVKVVVLKQPDPSE
jgi:hypothetical protein